MYSNVYYGFCGTKPPVTNVNFIHLNIVFTQVYYNAMKNTKTEKARRVDGLAAEYFLHANQNIHVYLFLLLNCLINMNIYLQIL